MSKNTSVSLGAHFETFIEERISQGRFQNKGDVIRAGLRLLEEEEHQFTMLQTAIRKGIESGIANDFNPQLHLEQLKATKKSNG
jgi:antitoxin ParD1/3/4